MSFLLPPRVPPGVGVSPSLVLFRTYPAHLIRNRGAGVGVSSAVISEAPISLPHCRSLAQGLLSDATESRDQTSTALSFSPFLFAFVSVLLSRVLEAASPASETPACFPGGGRAVGQPRCESVFVNLGDLPYPEHPEGSPSFLCFSHHSAPRQDPPPVRGSRRSESPAAPHNGGRGTR